MTKPRGRSSAEKKLAEHLARNQRIKRRMYVLQQQGRKELYESACIVAREEVDHALAGLLIDLAGLRPAKPLDPRTMAYVLGVIESSINDKGVIKSKGS